jgi:hypothetical protein
MFLFSGRKWVLVTNWGKLCLELGCCLQLDLGHPNFLTLLGHFVGIGGHVRYDEYAVVGLYHCHLGK